MKNLKRGLMFLLGLVVMSSCTKEEFLSEENVDELGMKTEAFDTKKVSSGLPLPKIIENEIVIRYDSVNITKKEKDIIKAKLTSKYKFSILETIACSCGETNIEKWVIDSTGISVENLRAALENDDAAGGVSGDYEFIFSVDKLNIVEGVDLDRIDKVLGNSEETIKIAVLDTGIDYSYFEGKFLYDSSKSENCDNEISGWDFVNGDNDPFDDHGHGTMVTKIITNNLDFNDVPYQILPVKAFNKDGLGSYFDAVCGFKYISSFDESFIVNASFGFYGLEYPDIMKDVIEANSDKMLVVNSSGNEGNDTDSVGNEHYPSGYDLDNMIVVGGYEDLSELARSISFSKRVSGYDLAPESNFGSRSVDVVAQFYHKIILSNNTNESVEGTSFAAPVVTARAALLYYNSQQVQRPTELKQDVFETSFSASGLSSKIESSRIIFSNQLYDKSKVYLDLRTLY